MKRAIIALLLSGALAACGTESEQANVDQGVEREEATTVLLPVPADPTVSFSVSFNVGSQNDPPGKEGLAYLTGLMIEDGATERNSYEAILEKLYPLASGYGLRVDRELSTLTGRTHTDNLEAFTALFTDAYLKPAFSDEDFQRLKSDTINYLVNELRYSSDEELGKATLYQSVYRDTPYAHPPEGTLAGLNAITLTDVRDFYSSNYTQDNVIVALAGGFDQALVEEIEATVQMLPAGTGSVTPEFETPEISGREVVLIDKPGADASISFGFPIAVHRGEPDFYALWIANSWLGEHRHSASHLFQVIRERRGLNYGDYSYIESFPEGGQRSMPPVNVARRHQIFEVWIRTLPRDQAHFAIRAAMRELVNLVDVGLTEEQFELTRAFLKKYVLHFADTTSMRLGYAVDDRFYDIDGEGHLARFRRMMDELTLEDVNDAIARHLQYDNVKFAVVTGNAQALREALVADLPSPMTYPSPKPAETLAEDEGIESFPLNISPDDVTVIPISDVFSGE